MLNPADQAVEDIASFVKAMNAKYSLTRSADVESLFWRQLCERGSPCPTRSLCCRKPKKPIRN